MSASKDREKPPSRRSQRLQNKNNPKYELAAKEALRPDTISKASTNKKIKFSGNNSNSTSTEPDNTAQNISPVSKPLVPRDVKKSIMEKYGSQQEDTQNNTASQTSSSPLSQQQLSQENNAKSTNSAENKSQTQ